MYWFGLLLCALLGVELGGVAAGVVQLTGDGGVAAGVVLVVVGANLVPWTGMAGFAAALKSRPRAQRLAERTAAAEIAAAVMLPALARIEGSQAVGEGPDLPLRLDLTVAPDGRPGYRAEIHATVNLMDLEDYRVGRIVVVEYDPDRLWRVKLLRSPSAELSSRAALAKIDSAPGSTLAVRPPSGPRTGPYRHPARAALLAVGLGLLGSVALFWQYFTG